MRSLLKMLCAGTRTSDVDSCQGRFNYQVVIIHIHTPESRDSVVQSKSTRS